MMVCVPRSVVASSSYAAGVEVPDSFAVGVEDAAASCDEEGRKEEGDVVADADGDADVVGAST